MNEADMELLQSCVVGAAFFVIAAFAMYRVLYGSAAWVDEDGLEIESQTSETREEVAVLDEIGPDTIYLPSAYLDATKWGE